MDGLLTLLGLGVGILALIKKAKTTTQPETIEEEKPKKEENVSIIDTSEAINIPVYFPSNRYGNTYLGDTSKPYDPFYDYKKEELESLLAYRKAEDAIRMRIVPNYLAITTTSKRIDNFTVAYDVSKVGLFSLVALFTPTYIKAPLFDTRWDWKPYYTRFRIEIFNPFTVSYTLKKIVVNSIEYNSRKLLCFNESYLTSVGIPKADNYLYAQTPFYEKAYLITKSIEPKKSLFLDLNLNRFVTSEDVLNLTYGGNFKADLQLFTTTGESTGHRKEAFIYNAKTPTEIDINTYTEASKIFVAQVDEDINTLWKLRLQENE